jgi:hypothetical protein
LTSFGESIEILTRTRIVRERIFQERRVIFDSNLGKQRGESLPDITQQSELERAAVAERFGPQIDLRDSRTIGEELTVGKIRASTERARQAPRLQQAAERYFPGARRQRLRAVRPPRASHA